MIVNDPVTIKKEFFPELPKIYLDIETTGLEPKDGAVILSVAFLVQKHDGFNPPKDDPIFEFEVTILPTEEEWAKASPEALKVNGMTLEYLKEKGVPLRQATTELSSFLKGTGVIDVPHVLIGQNPTFDLSFFRAYMPDLFWFGLSDKNLVNNIQLFKYVQRLDPTLRTSKYNGHALSRALGVQEEDVVHTAIGGAKVVFRNYWAIHDRVDSVISKYRQEALSGKSNKNILLPGGAKTFEDWKHKVAPSMGWESVGSEPHHFLDKDGGRWVFIAGAPLILHKL